MPSKNIIKSDQPDSHYHVYGRGLNGQRIFRDQADFVKFLNLFDRYLSLQESKNVLGQSFPNYYNRIELVSFCLMPNQFHLLIFQRQAGAMTEFMRSLLTSYSMYFNKKYSRSGPLLESRYKASLISDDTYLEHVTRYIHLVPRDWKHYDYSSLPYYLHQITDEWIRPERVTRRFETPTQYMEFLENTAEAKEMLDILKHELANGAGR